MSYSKYIWRNRGRDTEAIHVSQVIHIVKKLSHVCGRYFEYKVLSKAAKSLVLSTGSLPFGHGARYRSASIAGKTPSTNGSADAFALKSWLD